MKNLEKLTIPNILKNTLNKYSNKIALSWVDGKPLLYSDIESKVKYIISLLRENGIKRGDKVALLSENCPHWGVVYLGVTSMGAVIVPILTGFHENEILHILRHSETKALFISEKLNNRFDIYDCKKLHLKIKVNDFKIIENKSKTSKLKEVFNEKKKEFQKLKFDTLEKAGLIKSKVEEDDLAAIVYTSGTTGHSKGVMLSHKNIVYDAIQTLKIQKVTADDRLISILPLAHTYECTIGFIIPIIRGASVYYLKKPPTASVLLPAMTKIRPTMILTVPLIIEKIFKMKIHPTFMKNRVIKMLYSIRSIQKLLHRLAGKKLLKLFGKKLHFFGIGGALLSPEVEEFLIDAKIPYSIGYGLTETSPLIAGSSSHNTRFRSTGFVLPGLKVKIDTDSNNKEGEILVKGENVMQGYFKDPERTKNAFTEDRFFKTGDLGILKNDYLYIIGRNKNVIVGRSGENIYPEEIESILNEHDFVLESLVSANGDKLIARVFLNYEQIDRKYYKHNANEKRMKKNINKILRMLKKDTNSQLSDFSKINKIIEQTAPFEKTATMKIKRYLYT